MKQWLVKKRKEEDLKDLKDLSFSYKQLIWLCSTKQKRRKQREKPKPDTGGHEDYFENNKSKRQKVRKQAQVIRSLEIP